MFALMTQNDQFFMKKKRNLFWLKSEVTKVSKLVIWRYYWVLNGSEFFYNKMLHFQETFSSSVFPAFWNCSLYGDIRTVNKI